MTESPTPKTFVEKLGYDIHVPGNVKSAWEMVKENATKEGALGEKAARLGVAGLGVAAAADGVDKVNNGRIFAGTVETALGVAGVGAAAILQIERKGKSGAVAPAI